jgi:hypothetical protein
MLHLKGVSRLALCLAPLVTYLQPPRSRSQPLQTRSQPPGLFVSAGSLCWQPPGRWATSWVTTVMLLATTLKQNSSILFIPVDHKSQGHAIIQVSDSESGITFVSLSGDHWCTLDLAHPREQTVAENLGSL